MSRFYVRFMFLTTLLISATLLIIRAAPYDDHDLRELLLPEECPAPCFMGIRPGVTSVDEALRLLEASGWVNGIDNGALNKTVGTIHWEWNAQKPDWVRTGSRGKIWITESIVNTITVFSAIRLGETQLVLGMPEGELIDPSQDRSGRSALYIAYYNQKGLLLRNWQRCGVVEPLLGEMIVTFTVQSVAYNYPYRNSLRDVFNMCEDGVVLQ